MTCSGAELQIVARTRVEAEDPVIFDVFMDHVRVDGTQAHQALFYADAAKTEIENYCQLALFFTDFTAITGRWPGRLLELPVGPANDPEHVTVAQVELDGAFTDITEGWTFAPGRFPTITFEAEPAGPLRIQWRAGFGANAHALPRDLHHAVMDQALVLFDGRGTEDQPRTLCPAAARICARYRRVRIGA